MSQTEIKCQNPNCKRLGAAVKVGVNGEKFLTTKNRHDSEIHTQQINLDELVKNNYTLEDFTRLFSSEKNNEQ